MKEGLKRYLEMAFEKWEKSCEFSDAKARVREIEMEVLEYIENLEERCGEGPQGCETAARNMESRNADSEVQ